MKYKLGDKVVVVNDENRGFVGRINYRRHETPNNLYGVAGTNNYGIPEALYNVREQDIVSYDTHMKYSIQDERNDQTVRYAEWFKRTYETVSKAGGDPISFIERLTPDMIDAMVRNNIALVYKEENKNE